MLSYGLQAARASSSGVRTDNFLKVRFSTTLGERTKVEVTLSQRVGTRALLIQLGAMRSSEGHSQLDFVTVT